MTSQPAGRTDRLSGDPQALFVYGSLLFPEVLQVLLGRVPDRSPASAAGWRVAALPGRVYPGLVPHQGTVKGLLITSLSGHEWRVLDAFEDDWYELRRIPLSGGRQGWAYVCHESMEVDPSDWDSTHFATLRLAAFVEGCAAWRARYSG